MVCLLLACSPPPRIGEDAGEDASALDATGIDAVVIDTVEEPREDTATLGRACTRSSMCDDGIECTTDVCAANGRCENLPNADMCDDRVYCNGQEVCDSRRGCIRGEPINCNDGEVCTSDRCDEMTRTCISRPLDRDGDGDPDDHCYDRTCGDSGAEAGINDSGMLVCWVGRDCDDSNPRVASTLPEICDDGIDNNCNGAIDAMEPGGCRRAPNDRCDDPLDVSRGGIFTMDLSASPADYPLPCGGRLMRDGVARLRLTEPRDIAISVSSPTGVTSVAVQSMCGGTDPSNTLECDSGFPANVRRHSLPAGDYFIIVATSVRGVVDLSVQLTPATPQPANDVCAMATEIPVPMGGTFRSDLIGLRDDASTRCGGSANDAFYTFELTSPQNVSLSLAGARTDNLVLSLLSSCERTPVTLRCETGSSIQMRSYSLPAGRYYVAVEAFDPLLFTLSVNFSDPTPPPTGDTCASPLTLTETAPLMVSTGALENDYRPTCISSGRDAVMQFTLTDRRDVILTAAGASSDFIGLALHSVCPVERGNERLCTTNSNTTRLIALALDPGTYFVTLKTLRPADVQVTLRTYDLVPVTTPTGNDTCATARTITADRALFRATLVGLAHDYRGTCANATGPDAVYQLTLDRRRRLTAVLDTAFLNVFYVTRDDACPGMSPVSTTSTCTLGTRTTLDVTLDPGTYRIFVDALSGAGGLYTLYTQLD
ncbi:MAG: putative metal-binding motif-containing protein [Deltaproteobacteria bacterium]|nr:putative metal-binding motif-containing protein [Deltaproteobacteria bacterium]